MKLSKKLLLIVFLFFITASCILPSGVYDMFYPILANFPGFAEEEPEKDGGDEIRPRSTTYTRLDLFRIGSEELPGR